MVELGRVVFCCRGCGTFFLSDYKPIQEKCHSEEKESTKAANENQPKQGRMIGFVRPVLCVAGKILLHWHSIYLDVFSLGIDWLSEQDHLKLTRYVNNF